MFSKHCLLQKLILSFLLIESRWEFHSSLAARGSTNSKTRYVELFVNIHNKLNTDKKTRVPLVKDKLSRQSECFEFFFTLSQT